jgi:hypothetical protein
VRGLCILLLAAALPAVAHAERTDFPATPQERYQRAGEYLWFEDYRYGHTPYYDEHGIPRMAIRGELVYNPVFITQHGLRMWSLWKADQDRHALKVASQIGRWLLRNQSRGGWWLYHFDFPLAGIDATMYAPWGSAMQQGQAISLLTRLWRRDGKSKWLDAAKRATLPLLRRVSDDGMTARFHGHPFYEEYPTKPSSFTLNGFMFTLIGLHDLADQSPRSGRLFDEGIQTLKYMLPWYDQGDEISAYHLGYVTDPPRPVHANAWYHRVHVIELKALAEITGSRKLMRWSKRWKRVPPPEGMSWG